MKKMIWISIMFLLPMYGCGALKGRTLGAVPTEPHETITVSINSIPSGASVFEINEDGTLGQHLGTTPYDYKVGIAPQYVEERKSSKPLYCNEIFAWGKGTYWTAEGINKTLRLKVALWKEGNMFAVGERNVIRKYRKTSGVYSRWRLPEEIKSTRINWTIPLKSMEQWQAELTANAISSKSGKQVIVQQQQKDDLDSANSFLDVLLKINALK